jgi:hypothetical protein
MLAALNVMNGAVLAKCKPRHRHQERIPACHRFGPCQPSGHSRLNCNRWGEYWMADWSSLDGNQQAASSRVDDVSAQRNGPPFSYPDATKIWWDSVNRRGTTKVAADRANVGFVALPDTL